MAVDASYLRYRDGLAVLEDFVFTIVLRCEQMEYLSGCLRIDQVYVTLAHAHHTSCRNDLAASHSP